ncbi:MAG: ribosomal protection-like ABC-F family protein [Puniceicoccaceae bacterium]
MLNGSQLSLAHGPKVLFSDVSFSIRRGERIGLVGANGSGKTTLLRILSGEDLGQQGLIETEGTVRVGYLPQDGIEPGPLSLLEECRAAFPEVLELQEKLGELENLLRAVSGAELASLLEEIEEIDEKLRLLEADRVEGKIQRVLEGLGFVEADLGRQAREFSGGWRMRIALARLILSEPDLLLLDEPTNHLDLDTQVWMEQILAVYAGAILTVSHDRGFLDRVTNRTFHLLRGRLEAYEGNYGFFEEAASERRAQLEKSAEKQAKEIARVEKFVDRFRYKATKARQVQSRIKALERIDRIEVGDDRTAEISIRFPTPPRGPQRLVQLKEVAKRYGSLEVFSKISFMMERGEKVALVGRNGKGKSTLARLVAGVEPPSEGERKLGEGAAISWFAQHQAEELDPGMTVQACAEAVAEGDQRGSVRGLLGAFLFSGDDVLKRVGVLSGGEKNRLALVRMLLRPANLLVLDEPTNHLDIASKTRLQAALMEYEGAVLIVAHDRDFLDPIVDRVFAFEPDGLHDFPGDLSAYLWHRNESGFLEDGGRAGKSSSRHQGARKEPANHQGGAERDRKKREAAERAKLAPMKKHLAAIEGKVSALEKAIAEAEQAMMDPKFFDGSERMAKALADCERDRRLLEELMEEWAKLEEKVS